MSSETLPALPERDHEHERLVSIVFKLPFQQARFVSLLARGAIATTEQVQEYMGDKNKPKAIAAYARAALKDFGIGIQSKARVGYWMDPADQKTINEALDRYMEES